MVALSHAQGAIYTAEHVILLHDTWGSNLLPSRAQKLAMLRVQEWPPSRQY
jgi:hypothetical protein